MSWRGVAFLALGIVALVVVLATHDLGAVLAAVGGVGWGLIAVVAYHAVPLLADAEAWRLLFARTGRPRMTQALFNRWVGESVNTMLPVAYIGGEIVRIRIAVLHGAKGAYATAAVLVDLTLAVASEAPFALAGVVALLILARDGEAGFAWPALIGIGVLSTAGLVLFAFQRAQPFRRIAHLIGHFAGAERSEPLAARAAEVDAALNDIHDRRGALLGAAGWRLASWVLGTGEIWLSLHLLGQDVGLLDAFMIESLGQAIRTAAFFVPAGLGVQEGALILLGAQIGIGPETALALSLVKRVRELALGLPGLLAWQVAEGARLSRRS